MARDLQQGSYPLLTSLEARGPLTVGEAPVSYLLVEVRGGCLMITGRMPFKEDRDGDIYTGDEYQYVLESAEAEKLLDALYRDFKDRPEHTLALEFEFSNPRCPLYEYLDDLQLEYEYHMTKGEVIR